jgi:hypothetical protein
MYEEEFLEKLYDGISQRLRSSNESRTFYTQSTINLNKNDGEGIHSIVDSQSEASLSAPIIVTEAVFLPQENDKNLSSDNVTTCSDKSEEPRRKITRSNDDNIDKNSTEVFLEIDEDDYQEEGAPIVSSTSSSTKKNNHSSSIVEAFKPVVVPQRTSKASSSSSGVTKPQNKLVRTDPSLLKIDAFFRPAITQTSNAHDSDGDSELDGDTNADSINNQNGSNGMMCGVCLAVDPPEDSQRKSKYVYLIFNEFALLLFL